MAVIRMAQTRAGGSHDELPDWVNGLTAFLLLVTGPTLLVTFCRRGDHFGWFSVCLPFAIASLGISVRADNINRSIRNRKIALGAALTLVLAFGLHLKWAADFHARVAEEAREQGLADEAAARKAAAEKLEAARQAAAQKAAADKAAEQAMAEDRAETAEAAAKMGVSPAVYKKGLATQDHAHVECMATLINSATWSARMAFFAGSYSWSVSPDGSLTIVGDDVLMKNGFGGERRPTYSCTYDPARNVASISSLD